MSSTCFPSAKGRGSGKSVLESLAISSGEAVAESFKANEVLLGG